MTIDFEALFGDCGLVQKELEKLNVLPTDSNEIFAQLETHWQRADRVQFVTSQILCMKGLKNNFDGYDVIDLSDDRTLKHNDAIALFPATCQINNFMCDVNDNDRNKNTGYKVPQRVEETQEQNSEIVEVDGFRTEFQDQDDVRCKLLEEARIIHHILPGQNLEQIYSYLEANLDHKNRIQIVMHEFLTMELSQGVSEETVEHNGGSSKHEIHYNMQQASTSSKNVEIQIKNKQSSTSATFMENVQYDPLVLPSTSTEQNKRKLVSFDDEEPPSKKIKNNLDNVDQNLKNIPEGSSEIILTKNQQKCQSILVEMFPNVDPQYLKQQCKSVKTDKDFNEIITKTLEGETAVQEDNEQPDPLISAVPCDAVINKHYQSLLAILPDADPTYLLKICEELSNNENAMKTFVANALEKKDYPTLAEYEKRQEALALQKKYTENFSIEGFLEILPEPFKYFLEEKKNIAKISDHAMAYLKGRYKKIRIEDIKHTFRMHKYNLTLTCQVLDSFKGPFCRSRRSDYECRVPNTVDIPFLQEVAFIENKRKIQNYFTEKSEEKKKAFQVAKERGELLTCGCCYDEEVMIEDIAACNDGHLFCKGCVNKGAEVRIGDGKTTFPCLDDCEAEFSLKTLQTVLKPSVLSKVLLRKQFEEVKAAGIEDLETCPFCDFATIPPHGDKIFRCLNPECMRESCRNCKEPNHIPFRCDEIEKSQELKMRTFIEDRMTEALVRTCWKCEKKFVKEGGCNKMRCTCGAMMCYVCRQPINGYNHFQIQGERAKNNKCPLTSSDNEVHVKPVKQEAEKAKQEIQSRNPEIKLIHDPTKVLPKSK